MVRIALGKYPHYRVSTRCGFTGYRYKIEISALQGKVPLPVSYLSVLSIPVSRQILMESFR